MKLIQVRLTDHIVTLNEDEWPVRFHHTAPSIDFSIEVRIDNQLTAYVCASVAKDGERDYSGRCLTSYSELELYRYVSTEAFSIARTLEVPVQYIWPLVEQFPAFSDSGVKISDAEAFEEPIRELIRRGATPQEVIESLDISRDLYEFVTREKLPIEPPRPQEEMMEPADMDDDAPAW